jgi:hypothetical protein
MGFWPFMAAWLVGFGCILASTIRQSAHQQQAAGKAGPRPGLNLLVSVCQATLAAVATQAAAAVAAPHGGAEWLSAVGLTIWAVIVARSFTSWYRHARDAKLSDRTVSRKRSGASTIRP